MTFWEWIKSLFASKATPPASVIPIKPSPVPNPVIVSSSKKVMMIDVSHYEPIPDYVKLKASGVFAVYMKATEHAIDSLLHAHVKAAQAAGLPCGAYHFFHASGDGAQQATLFLGAVKDLKLELRHCLDWESGSADGMSSAHQQIEADKWLDAVEKAAGHVPCIYGGEAFLRELNLPAKYIRYILWLAHYGCLESHLRIPGPWTSYAGWQFTDAQAISGLSSGHHVDASWISLEAFKV